MKAQLSLKKIAENHPVKSQDISTYDISLLNPIGAEAVSWAYAST